jgi:hypothetical protein
MQRYLIDAALSIQTIIQRSAIVIFQQRDRGGRPSPHGIATRASSIASPLELQRTSLSAKIPKRNTGMAVKSQHPHQKIIRQDTARRYLVGALPPLQVMPSKSPQPFSTAKIAGDSLVGGIILRKPRAHSVRAASATNAKSHLAAPSRQARQSPVVLPSHVAAGRRYMLRIK